MDITINGNINIISQQAVSLEKESTAEHSFEGLLDNEATFRELLVCLRERAKERVSETSGNTEEEDVLVKAKRSPGSEQLRSSYKKIAQITVGEATCEVYENGYAVFDNGDRNRPDEHYFGGRHHPSEGNRSSIPDDHTGSAGAQDDQREL